MAEQLAAAVRSGGTVWLYGLMEGLTFKGHGAECLFRWGGCCQKCVLVHATRKVLAERTAS
jgi:hypothetical protein